MRYSKMEKNHRCNRCNEPLMEGTEVWLNLNRETGKFTSKANGIRENEQEWFPFGKTCAKIQVNKVN